MSKALNKRMADAFGKIYDMGDSGLDYMDRHVSLDTALMEHFYCDTLRSLSVADRTRLAVMLEEIADDMSFDLEDC